MKVFDRRDTRRARCTTLSSYREAALPTMGPRTVLFRPRQPLTLLFALAAKDGITRLIRSALHLYGGERWLHPMLGDCAHGAFYHNTSERRPALRRLAHLYKTNDDWLICTKRILTGPMTCAATPDRTPTRASPERPQGATPSCSSRGDSPAFSRLRGHGLVYSCLRPGHATADSGRRASKRDRLSQAVQPILPCHEGSAATRHQLRE
jgi:hypothetical protein